MGDLHGLDRRTAGELSRRALWKPALLHMVACSLLFLIAYGGTNRITALRSDVGTWCYEWELSIPLVPWMIIPYWSLDLLFLASFFLCTSRVELGVLSRRISLAILGCGVCFLVLPLRCCFPREEVAGVFGPLFDAIRTVDQPYNLAPSLHIVLRTILAFTYERHSRGATRVVSHLWFSLIGISTLLTHQHHFVDVVSGFMFGALCFYLVREETEPNRVTPNLRIAVYYGLGAASCIAIASLGSYWLWFLWPALSLGIVSSAYAGLGPGVYRKARGRVPLSARWILAPCLLGQYLSLVYYRRRCRPWDEVAPGLIIGRALTDREARTAIEAGVVAVLDLTAEFSEARPFLALPYRNIQILDLTAPTQEQLREAVGFIRAHAASGEVYVHCKIGYSRSAAVAGAHLLSHTTKAPSVEATAEIIATMRLARPSLVVRPEALAAIREFSV